MSDKHYFSGHYYTHQAIQAAYRELAKDNHPDRANARMQEINAEHEILLEQFEREGVAGFSIEKPAVPKVPVAEIKHQDTSKPRPARTIPHQEDRAANVAHIEWQRGQAAREAEAREARHRENEMQRIFNSAENFVRATDPNHLSNGK